MATINQALPANLVTDYIANTAYTTLYNNDDALNTEIGTKQASHAILTAIASFDATGGFVVQTGASTFTKRTITSANADYISLTNGDGVSGDIIVNIGGKIVTTDNTQTLLNKTITDLIMTGTPTAPTGTDGDSSTQVANQTYVNTRVANAINGTGFKDSVRVVASTLIGTATYDNGTNGVGAKLTADSNAPLPNVDGVALSINDRILYTAPSNLAYAGIYIVTDLGSVGTPWILTRANDFNSVTTIKTAYIPVQEGTSADRLFNMTTDGTITIGSTTLTFTDAGGATQIVAGDGLTKSGDTLSVNVDSSSIEISADTLQVKALGITNAMLAGSIDDAKLSTITTGNKVSGSAIQLAVSSVVMNNTGLDINIDSSLDKNAGLLGIKDGGVTTAKIASMAAGSVLANTTGSSAAPSEVDIDTTFKTALALVKADVGLGNADNTSDATKRETNSIQAKISAGTNTTLTKAQCLIANQGVEVTATSGALTISLPAFVQADDGMILKVENALTGSTSFSLNSTNGYNISGSSSISLGVGVFAKIKYQYNGGSPLFTIVQ